MRRMSQKVVIAPDLMPVMIKLTMRTLLHAYLDPRNRPDGVVNAKLQADMDGLLWQVLQGRDPGLVFRLDIKKKRGERKDVRREQSMCAEVMRLTRDLGATAPDAKDAVAQAFEVEVSTVERALKAWRARFNEMGFLASYIGNLRTRKLI